jgi:hypothetical protein
MRFKDNKDETVTDITTGLMWQKEMDGNPMNWEAAISYCKNLSLGGYNDWRLPTIQELHSIVDYSRYSPAIDIEVFPDTLSSDYWSSTTDADSSGYAWRVGFDGGFVGCVYKSASYYVRAVRTVSE